MKESVLVKFSLIVTIIGLVLLFSVMKFSSFPELSLEDIGEENEGSKVMVFGVVEEVRNVDGVQIITLQQPSSIPVFLFGNSTLREGQSIEVIGRVQEFKGEKEIVADRIRVVS